jgi:hypothetical protein
MRQTATPKASPAQLRLALTALTLRLERILAAEEDLRSEMSADALLALQAEADAARATLEDVSAC